MTQLGGELFMPGTIALRVFTIEFGAFTLRQAGNEFPVLGIELHRRPTFIGVAICISSVFA